MHYNLVTFVKMHAVFFIKALCPTNNSIKVRGEKKNILKNLEIVQFGKTIVIKRMAYLYLVLYNLAKDNEGSGFVIFSLYQ